MEKVIFTEQMIGAQLEDFFKKYPLMSIQSQDSDTIILSGSARVFRSYNDYTIDNCYSLNVIIPLNTSSFPYVVDIGGHINSAYHHYYKDNRRLCLETEAQIALRFIDGFSLVDWMEEYVEVYYFSYEYYQRYGEFPFGERAHNELGILETYQDYFSTSDIVEAYKVLTYVCSSPYRGHAQCPCGSNKKIRNCHGVKMLPVYMNIDIMERIQKDCKVINNYVREIVTKSAKKAE